MKWLKLGSVCLLLAVGCAAKSVESANLEAPAPQTYAVVPMESSAQAREFVRGAEDQFVEALAQSQPHVELMTPGQVMERADKYDGAARIYDDMMNAHLENNRTIPSADLRAFRNNYGAHYVIVTVLYQESVGPDLVTTIEGQLWDASSGALIWEGSARDATNANGAVEESVARASTNLAQNLSTQQPAEVVVARRGGGGEELAFDLAVVGCLAFFVFLSWIVD